MIVAKCSLHDPMTMQLPFAPTSVSVARQRLRTDAAGAPRWTQRELLVLDSL